MGWTFTQNANRQDIIANRVKPWYGTTGDYHEVIAYSTAGNVLWSVRRIIYANGDKPVMFIGCDLLATHKGYGWGYKDMCESTHPFYYTCPLSYLEMVTPESPNDFNLEWRDGVKAYWAERKRKRAIKVVVGQAVKLVGSTIPEITITSVKPLLGTYAGTVYRIPRKMIAE